MGDFFAAVLWVLALIAAAYFLMWSMSSWLDLFMPDVSWLPWPL